VIPSNQNNIVVKSSVLAETWTYL